MLYLSYGSMKCLYDKCTPLYYLHLIQTGWWNTFILIQPCSCTWCIFTTVKTELSCFSTALQHICHTSGSSTIFSPTQRTNPRRIYVSIFSNWPSYASTSILWVDQRSVAPSFTLFWTMWNINGLSTRRVTLKSVRDCWFLYMCIFLHYYCLEPLGVLKWKNYIHFKRQPSFFYHHGACLRRAETTVQSNPA